ncbi:MAG TPA: sigma-70 family RNA polymerase sigma factor [Thermoanaerobaculia bacterium]|nr:sigma-70 family RNA polymerase sigma factor [Thermoanaerobaculia bacterium]
MLDPNAAEVPPLVPDGSADAAVIAGTAAGVVDAGILYEQYRDLLVHVACRKFRVPDPDAENLMQEVFLAYIQTEARVEDTKAWLVAAMCNASRHYWRQNSRTEQMPEDIGDHTDPGSHGLADQFAMSLTLRKAIRYLQPKCRETLYLHYYEGRSAADVAREMDTTSRYAEKLIHNCLKRVREIYFSITSLKR